MAHTSRITKPHVLNPTNQLFDRRIFIIPLGIIPCLRLSYYHHEEVDTPYMSS
ncbi:hypothetical protein [Rubritalea tangerina]|uniref:hypothetical protein n=1 Tax=Rubritalea tangerina TaxID=430798 RepID=UPI003608D327